MKTKDCHINYIELKAKNLEEIKTFYSSAFSWVFTDYGPNYVSFSESGVAGGFELTDQEVVNGALVVIHHDNLEHIKAKIIELGCRISVDIFSFPGGSRFQFIDPSGNELAVWCEVVE